MTRFSASAAVAGVGVAGRARQKAAPADLLFGAAAPGGLEAVLEERGDDVTETDRCEQELSEEAPGRIRDTSMPRAIAGSLRASLLGHALERERTRGAVREAVRSCRRAPPRPRAGGVTIRPGPR